MANVYSILQSSYLAAGDNIRPSKSRYVNVDPAAFQGKWTGKYANGKAFEFQISNVNGFRATVRYRSGATVSFQQVLIRDNAFRVGDSKFVLVKPGMAQVKTAITDPYTGTVSATTAFANQD